MAIPAKQIGWSQQSNLLWEISKQLDTTLAVLCTGPCPTTTTTTTILSTTTTTTTIACNCYTITNLDPSDTTYSYIDCNGLPVLDLKINIAEIVSFCALLGSVNFNSEIVDNGTCGLDCPPTTTTTTTTICNCREIIEAVLFGFNFYTCLGEYVECNFLCVSPVGQCIDISQPYSGVEPSLTITETCNCNPA